MHADVIGMIPTSMHIHGLLPLSTKIICSTPSDSRIHHLCCLRYERTSTVWYAFCQNVSWPFHQPSLRCTSPPLPLCLPPPLYPAHAPVIVQRASWVAVYKLCVRFFVRFFSRGPAVSGHSMWTPLRSRGIIGMHARCESLLCKHVRYSQHMIT